jgi:hypothetical protein
MPIEHSQGSTFLSGILKDFNSGSLVTLRDKKSKQKNTSDLYVRVLNDILTGIPMKPAVICLTSNDITGVTRDLGVTKHNDQVGDTTRGHINCLISDAIVYKAIAPLFSLTLNHYHSDIDKHNPFSTIYFDIQRYAFVSGVTQPCIHHASILGFCESKENMRLTRHLEDTVSDSFEARRYIDSVETAYATIKNTIVQVTSVQGIRPDKVHQFAQSYNLPYA